MKQDHDESCWQPHEWSVQDYARWKRRTSWIVIELIVCTILLHVVFVLTDNQQVWMLLLIYGMCAWAIGYNLYHSWMWHHRYNHPDCRKVYEVIISRPWFDATSLSHITGLDINYVADMLSSFYADQLIKQSPDQHWMCAPFSNLQKLVGAK